MEPLDLSVRPPRSPYAQMHGIYMIPRTIDKLRAQLPGGKLGPYSLSTEFGPGLSIFLLDGLRLSEKTLFQLVQQAQAEEDIVNWLQGSVDLSGKARINEMLLGPTAGDVLELIPQSIFDEFYPAAKTMPKTAPMFDILIEDDRLMFPAYFAVRLRQRSSPAEIYAMLPARKQ